MNNEILLNKTFAGKYLELENYENIAHEFINLYQSDNNKYYVYVTDDGSISMNHNDKIGTIIFTRNCCNGIIEVLAKAEGLKQIFYTQKAWKTNNHVNNVQRAYIKENNISYGGKLLYDIVDKNNYHSGGYAYLTFEADRIIMPKENIYLTLKKENKSHNTYLLKDKWYGHNHRCYITKAQTPKSYNVLQKIINDNTLWNSNNVEKLKKQKVKEEYNIISLLKKDKDELLYSNFFEYIFNNDKTLFQEFAHKILEIEDFSDKCKIIREKEHIDILINDNKNVIVIENKIKSGIHGEKHDLCKNIVKNQLYDYKKFVKSNKEYKDLNPYFYIFVPDYNYIDKYELHGYNIIRYSKIYNFFKDKNTTIPYYQEFLYALSKHIYKHDNSLEDVIGKRILNAINS